jgi:hypothetical protein
MASKYTLPSDFLSGPAPNLTKSKIDFAKAGLPGSDGHWAVVLDGVLSKAECGQLVAAAEATTDGVWERALVNIGGGAQAMIEDVRNCGRIIWDDRALMEKLWARIEGAVPEIHRLEKWASVTGNGPVKRNEVWRVTRLNERGRFLKYVGGEYFKGTYAMVTALRMVLNARFANKTHPAHCDGTYETPDRKERSYFTLHLYLNDMVDEDGQEALVGGATTFYSWDMEKRLDVEPRCGRVLMFQ